METNGKPPSALRDFVPKLDKFIGASDFAAADGVAAVLERFGGKHALKIGNDLSFHDLRTSPVVLIGYSYTRWRGLSGDLRYSIQASKWPRGISDSGKPTSWVVPEAKLADEDYALVARVFHPETGKLRDGSGRRSCDPRGGPRRGPAWRGTSGNPCATLGRCELIDTRKRF